MYKINDLVGTGLDTLPLSYRRLVGAETSKLQQVFVTNVLYIVRSSARVQERIMGQREMPSVALGIIK